MSNPIKSLKLKRRAITFLAGIHFFGNPSKQLKIVGVTGTNGKTTTATLLYRVATALGYRAGLIGTVENIIIDERRPAIHTTPDPLHLNALLKEMAAKNCEYVFMEVSSHALDQNRVAGVTFTGGIFTNLTHDHLDYHETFEEYFKAKKKFFHMLSRSSFALSNIDDDSGIKMTESIEARSFYYGFDHDDEEDFHGEIKKSDFSGIDMTLNQVLVQSKLIGRFNAYNLLAIWSTCDLLGFDMKEVKKILETIAPPRGRFENLSSPDGKIIIVDYAHTPDALENVLLTAKEVKSENAKLISIVGCGGDRDPLKRPIMGTIATALSDVSIFTADNPRSEDPLAIIDQMKKELSPEALAKVKTIPSRREAIGEAFKIAKQGDIILCAGKGHEDYQEIKGVKNHFSDVEEFKKLFSQTS